MWKSREREQSDPAPNGSLGNATKGDARAGFLKTQQSGWRRVSNGACFLTGAKELSHEHGRFVAESLFSQIEHLEERKLEFKAILTKNMKIYRPLRNLATIPGIDVVRANIIMAIVCMPHRFENKYKFWAYCMLVRYFQISDGKIYGSRKIRARFELKSLFMGAAENAIQGENCLKDHYDAKRRAGVDHRGAKISVARLIAAAALSILKNNSIFDESYNETHTERTQLRKTLNEASI